MFDDLIKKKKKKAAYIWDYKKYEKNPYCPVCNTTNVVTMRDSLKSNKMTNWKKCKDCGVEWREEYNKNLDLELII